MSQITIKEIINKSGNSINEKGESTYEEWTEERNRIVNLNNIIRRGISSPNKYSNKCLYWIDITSFDYPGDYDDIADNFDQSHTIGITEKSYEKVNDLLNAKFCEEFQKKNITKIDDPLYGMEI